MTCERDLMHSRHRTPTTRMPHEKATYCGLAKQSLQSGRAYNYTDDPNWQEASCSTTNKVERDIKRSKINENRTNKYDVPEVPLYCASAVESDKLQKSVNMSPSKGKKCDHDTHSHDVLVTLDTDDIKSVVKIKNKPSDVKGENVENQCREGNHSECHKGGNLDICSKIGTLDIGKEDNSRELYKGGYPMAELKEDSCSVDLSTVDTEESSLDDDSSETDNTEFAGCSESRTKPEVCIKDHKGKDQKKRRLRNLIPALRRSQSVGCESQLVPEHALFLEHNQTTENEKGNNSESNDRRMIHKTCSADSAMMAADVLPINPQEYMRQKQKSSIARNMRQKLQKLKRRNTDSLLGAAFLGVRGTSRISNADALEWANSFESLLTDKNGLEMFRDFLKSEFSEENIEFWIACEEFKTIRTNKLVQRAQKIYSDFIAIKSPKQINLDSKTRLETIANLENPTRDVFREAQKRIQFLMENDSYKRFLESEPYRGLIQKSTSS